MAGGYHLTEITKGVLGELSKIQEELDELKDAEAQNSKVMIGCELSDLYGAIEAYAEKYNLSMDDLSNMSEITKRAFAKGERLNSVSNTSNHLKVSYTNELAVEMREKHVEEMAIINKESVKDKLVKFLSKAKIFYDHGQRYSNHNPSDFLVIEYKNVGWIITLSRSAKLSFSKLNDQELYFMLLTGSININEELVKETLSNEIDLTQNTNVEISAHNKCYETSMIAYRTNGFSLYDALLERDTNSNYTSHYSSPLSVDFSLIGKIVEYDLGTNLLNENIIQYVNRRDFFNLEQYTPKYFSSSNVSNDHLVRFNEMTIQQFNYKFSHGVLIIEHKNDNRGVILPVEFKNNRGDLTGEFVVNLDVNRTYNFNVQCGTVGITCDLDAKFCPISDSGTSFRISSADSVKIDYEVSESDMLIDSYPFIDYTGKILNSKDTSQSESLKHMIIGFINKDVYLREFLIDIYDSYIEYLADGDRT